MDKELLRIVIIATGLLIIMGMLVWSYLRNKKSREAEVDLFEAPAYKAQANDMFAVEDDDLGDDLGAPPAGHHFFDQEDAIFEPEEDDDLEPAPRVSAPAIIQFSLIAKADEGFNGLDLVNAFEIVGLEYGSLKIYERLDANRLVDFGVACMVEPGTFPTTDLETFFCPGLVFFMQPGALDDAQAVFDDYIDTLQLLAIELDGTILDHHRQPLTDTTIRALRQSL
ncbi:MAG: cell division protein ZipA C-terminal FtsZ-binding domain-containing protein [Methylococcales bacterium]|nr:cell division protein ZipA C-terminal FtsZ-binding domain-containing protein [Methylococcales bacterium]